MYVVELGFSDEAGLAMKQLPVFAKSLVPGLVGCVVYASLALGVSSLTEKTNQAALLYFGLVMIAFVMSQMLSFALFGNDAWQAVSPGNCIQRIAADLLPLPAAARLVDPHIEAMPVSAAWLGASGWTAAGLAALVVRIRKVEVVS
jgi:hypothetical protein